MITDRAIQSIDEIVLRAARSRLVLNPGDHLEFAATRQRDAALLSDEDFVVLTISSIGFRMLTMIHLDDNEAARRYYGHGLSDLAFTDILFEVANLFCGAINQELVTCFPEIGMSTPYYLDGRCTPHLAGLKPAYLGSYAIAINSDVSMKVSVCVCAHRQIDFVVADEAVEQVTGELELF